MKILLFLHYKKREFLESIKKGDFLKIGQIGHTKRDPSIFFELGETIKLDQYARARQIEEY